LAEGSNSKATELETDRDRHRARKEKDSRQKAKSKARKGLSGGIEYRELRIEDRREKRDEAK